MPIQEDHNPKGVDAYNSEEEKEKSTREDESEGEDSYPCEGDLLMMRRVLKNQQNMFSHYG